MRRQITRGVLELGAFTVRILTRIVPALGPEEIARLAFQTSSPGFGLATWSGANAPGGHVDDETQVQNDMHTIIYGP